MKVLLIGPYARQKKVGQKVKVKREDFYPSAALLHLAAILRVNKYKPIIIDLKGLLFWLISNSIRNKKNNKKINALGG